MKALAEEEIMRLRNALPEAERALAIAMLPRDSADAKPAMLEIRAGTGGDEAALFAADLYRMYERFAAEQGWRVEPVSMNAREYPYTWRARVGSPRFGLFPVGGSSSPSRPRNEGKLPTGVPSADGMSQ